MWLEICFICFSDVTSPVHEYISQASPRLHLLSVLLYKQSALFNYTAAMNRATATRGRVIDSTPADCFPCWWCKGHDSAHFSLIRVCADLEHSWHSCLCSSGCFHTCGGHYCATNGPCLLTHWPNETPSAASLQTSLSSIIRHIDAGNRWLNLGNSLVCVVFNVSAVSKSR